MIEEPKLIDGGFFEDERGRLDFVNAFDATKIKRIYFTTNTELNYFRAWQGHKIEKRWFYCVKGSFEVKLIKIDSWDLPSENLMPKTFILEEFKPQILYIPPGFANGFSALKKDSKMMIMSDYLLGEVEGDDYRFENNKWI